jgi:LPS export ABC transporter permease LptG
LAEATLPARTSSRPRGLRPTVLDFYLVRGVAGPFLITTLAVCAAMMLERALRLVHELAGRGADLSYFLPMLGQLVPYYLDLALPAAFMVALVLLVARLDDRLELEAMLASGLSLGRIAMPLVGFGLVVAAASLVAGGWLEPLGRHRYRALTVEAINSGRLARLPPRGIFQPSPDLVVTYDRRDQAGRAAGIFVWQRGALGRELVLASRSGTIGFLPGRRAFGIDFEDGRYIAEAADQTAQPHMFAFRTLAFREPLRLAPSASERSDAKVLTLAELAALRRSGDSTIPARARDSEFFSRIARAATIPLLPLLVLPLAFATKKGRRGIGILIGGILLAAFHHSMNLAKQLALNGQADAGTAISAVTAGCALVAALVFLSGRHLPSHSPIAALIQSVRRPLAGPATGERAMPKLHGRTLAAYLGWTLAKWSLIALLAIVILLQMVDLFDRGQAFAERGFGPGEIGHFLWLRLPPMVQQALPMAALAGAMIGFASLGRSHEMTAIRAAGVSQWKILAMALPVPLVLSLAIYGLSERITPHSQIRFAAWWEMQQPHGAESEPAARWFRIGGEIVRAGRASPDGTRLQDVAIFRRDGRGLLDERIRARSASTAQSGWRLHDAQISRYDFGRREDRRVVQLDWPVRMTAEEVTAFFAAPAALSAATARRALEVAAPVGEGEARFATRLYRSAAEPLAPLLMLLFALPLAFVSPRAGRSWPALLYALGGGLLYLVGDGVLTVLGQVGALPPSIGAWGAPLIAALLGITVLLYSER